MKAKVTNKHLDALCRKIVMERWGQGCEYCGRSDRPLQWAHGVSRRYLSLRWSLNPRNSFALCAGCHLATHHQPTEWAEWLRNKLGEKDYEKLRMILKTPRKVDKAAILVALRKEAGVGAA